MHLFTQYQIILNIGPKSPLYDKPTTNRYPQIQNFKIPALSVLPNSNCSKPSHTQLAHLIHIFKTSFIFQTYSATLSFIRNSQILLRYIYPHSIYGSHSKFQNCSLFRLSNKKNLICAIF